MTTYKSDNFEFLMRRGGGKLLLDTLFNGYARTDKYPGVVSILSKRIPSIFMNKCFNPQNLPFKNEVSNTELGHLFEHLILENLKIESVKKYGRGDFRGETFWDWNINQYGKFNISISCPPGCSGLVTPSLSRSISIMEEIFKTKGQTLS